MKKFALLFLAVAASGCPDIKTDPAGESPNGPTVEFDPSNKIVPFPNNLLLNPMTGKVTLPPQCNEGATAKALREGMINKLDGFGTFEAAMSVTFSTPYDKASLEANLVMYKRAAGGTAVDPATAQKIPTVVIVGTTTRFDADCANPVSVDSATIVPRVPLDQKSTYVVALVDGVKTASGDSFVASSTWSLVRQSQNPVTVDASGQVIADRTPLDPNNPEQLEQLKGINLLWNAHANALGFLKAKGTEPSSVLLAWEFNTQTTTDPLDPTVAGSPAAKILDDVSPFSIALGGNLSPPPPPTYDRTQPPFSTCPGTDDDTQCFLKISLGFGDYATGNATCAALGCANVGHIVVSLVGSKQYQVQTPNPYTGPGAMPVPSSWSDPVAPAMVTNEAIQVVSFVPASAMPPGGYPVVVFQHGFTRSKSDVAAIGSQLAAAGFVTVAIDAVGHGSRAVRISSDAAKGCADDPRSTRPDHGPSPSTKVQCYAPFLSPNLAATRDGIRQTVLDHQRLVAALKACGTTACGDFLKVDPAHIVYMGQSLGGIMGSISASVTPDIKSAVLNVPGVGWADLLENTQSLEFRCLLVDGLIDAGLLTGAKLDLSTMPPTGLCTTEAWKTQPGYRQFSLIGRWVLDPADPANYTRKLAAKRFLIQEVVGDGVVPNISTGNEGALTGLMPGTADCGTGATTPSAVIATNPMSNKWARYPTLAVGAPGCGPGNTFVHGSLLSPAATPGTDPPTVGLDGRLATARMQTDAIFFLLNNK